MQCVGIGSTTPVWGGRSGCALNEGAVGLCTNPPLLIQQLFAAPRLLIRLKPEVSGYHPMPLFEMIYRAI